MRFGCMAPPRLARVRLLFHCVPSFGCSSIGALSRAKALRTLDLRVVPRRCEQAGAVVRIQALLPASPFVRRFRPSYDTRQRP